MKNKNIYLYSGLIILLFFIWMLSNSDKKNETFSEIAKISLRDIGHQLLLSNQDSTSLVLPVIEIDKLKYKLSFQKQLFIEPDSLVSIIKKSLKKAILPKHYRVEVIKCTDNEVAYSYEVKNTKETSIIPCGGRFLPKSCYTITICFTNKTTFSLTKKILLVVLIFSAFILLRLLFRKKKQVVLSEKSDEKHTVIGSFKFYSEQNKLVRETIEINLSKKECELLAIFVANPNQIIKRDELTKRVWEDHGVFVGRSLDTYISKLRKKLATDTSVKLINIHGVGYKLEVKD